MTDPHTQEQTQTHNPEQEPGQAQGWEQEPVGLAGAAPGTTATSVLHGTGPGLVVVDAVRQLSHVMDALISGCGLPVRFCLWPVVCGHG